VSGDVVRLRSALRDLDEVADYIRRQGGPARAVRFLRAADATFQRLAALPGVGARYEPDDPAFADLRYCPVLRFKKYLVFYRPIAGGIEVLRVLHGARDIAAILAGDLGGLEDEGGDEIDA
jgi:toxin ParE1/3/4